MEITSKSKMKFNIRRLYGFVKQLLKGKKGVFGIGIIVFFVIVALIPHWLTPYHPTHDHNLAGCMAAPSWLRYIPGGGSLCENVFAIEDSGFNDPSSIKQYDVNITNPDQVHIEYSTSVGSEYAFANGSGSLAFTYLRNTTPSGNVSVVMSKTFSHPYGGYPERFAGDISLLVEGTAKEIIEGYPILDVPVLVDVFITNGTGNKFYLWSSPETPVVNPSDGWFGTRTSAEDRVTDLDSRVDALKIKMYGFIADPLLGQIPYWHKYPISPERDLFGSRPQNMTIGVEMKFLDNEGSGNAHTTVYIDGFYFRTYGTAWGLLGTDKLGKDLFSQLVYGVRISLYVGLLASVIGVVIGLIIGMSAGYLGKAADEVLMRFADMLLVIPGLPLLIVMIAVLGATLNNLILLLGFLGWMGFSRLVRSQVLSLRERPFVEAAKAAGAGNIHIMTRHILPNVMSLAWVTLATSVPGAVVTEASLSFLGFYDPNVMSWGRMLFAIREGGGAFEKWWWVLPPGFGIALIAISFIMIGFAMDEVLNPRLRERA